MFDIPELDEMICSELAPHDLIQCTQVNEQWHRVVTPYIWRDITHIQYQYWSAFRRIVLDDYLQERQQQQRLRLQSPKSSSSSSSSSSSHPHSSLLAKYSPYIRKIPPLGELLIVLRSRYNPAHPPPRSVKRRKKVERKEPTEYDLMRHLIKHCCSIDIEGYSITTSDCDSLDVFETTADFILPVVRRLFVTDNNIRFEPDGHLAPWKLKYMLSRCSSKLEKLKLTSITLSAEDEGSHAEENEGKEPISGFQPKELSLYKYKENPSSIEFWSWLWRRCGSLERLKVYLSDGTVESLADGMLNHMPNLSEIHLGQSDKEFHFGWAVKPLQQWMEDCGDQAYCTIS
ncbi:hypothetical protein BGX26_001992 [Mortierella sp. AD094]|nr:hypothetical protein BGX26_001992 [Mortierella sp. AD094]